MISHSMLSLRGSPSASLLLALQLTSALLLTLAGLMLGTATTGARLSMLTVLLSVALAPLLSLTVAVQVTLSPGMAEVLLRSKLAPLWVLPLTNQLKLGLTASSASLAVAVQLRMLSLWMPLPGEIETLLSAGGLLAMLMLASVVGPLV